MHLKKEQRFQIILKASLGSSRTAVNAFNRKHRTTITHDTVKKLIGKLKKQELLQIKRDAVEDVQPAMKVKQLRYLQCLHRVPQ